MLACTGAGSGPDWLCQERGEAWVTPAADFLVPNLRRRTNGRAWCGAASAALRVPYSRLPRGGCHFRTPRPPLPRGAPSRAVVRPGCRAIGSKLDPAPRSEYRARRHAIKAP